MAKDIELAFDTDEQSLDALFEIDETLLSDLILVDDRVDIEDSSQFGAVSIFADMAVEVGVNLRADLGDISLGDLSLDYFLTAELDTPDSAAVGSTFQITTGENATVDAAAISSDTLAVDDFNVGLVFENLGGVVDNISVTHPLVGKELFPGDSVLFQPFITDEITLIDIEDRFVSNELADTLGSVLNAPTSSVFSNTETETSDGGLPAIVLESESTLFEFLGTLQDLRDIVPGIEALDALTVPSFGPFEKSVISQNSDNVVATLLAELDFTIASPLFKFSLEVEQSLRFEPSVISTTFTIEGEETALQLGEALEVTIEDRNAPELADGELNGTVAFGLGGQLIATTAVRPVVDIEFTGFTASGEATLVEDGRTPDAVGVVGTTLTSDFLRASGFNEAGAPTILLEEAVVTLPEGFFQTITEDFAIDVRDPLPPEFENARAEIEVDAGQRSVVDFGLVEVSDPDTDTPIEIVLIVSEGALFAPSLSQITATANGNTLSLVGRAEDLEDFLRGGLVEVEIPEGAGNQQLNITLSDNDGFNDVAFDPIQLIVNPVEVDLGGGDGGGGGGDGGGDNENAGVGGGEDDFVNAGDRDRDGEADDPLDLDSPFSFNGGGGDDGFSGGNGDDLFIGGPGNDDGTAFGGQDQFFGGEGQDRFFGGDGNDVQFGGDGLDTLFGGNDSDRLFGGDGDDDLDGGDGADTLIGGEGDDSLTGGDGPDFANGGPGDDAINAEAALGGPGDDRITADIAAGGPGNDSINGREVAGDDGDDLIFSTERGSGGDGDDTIDARGLAFGGDGSDSILASGAGRFEGGDGNDILTTRVLFESVEFFGGDGADTLNGSRVADTLVGGDGVDEIRADQGDDRLEGGDDADFLDGGFGVDTLFGGAGADILQSGGSGVAGVFEELFGEGGDDSLRGDGDSDSLFGGLGRDTLDGRGGNDFLRDEQNISDLDGGDGDDTLIAGDFDDFLAGGRGDDSIVAGAGDDFIRTGVGFDDDANVVDAGAGDDLIVTFGADDNVDAGGDDDEIVIQNRFAQIDGGGGFDTAFIGDDLIPNPDPNVGDFGRDFFEDSISVVVDLNQGVIETLQGIDAFTLDISNLINVERIVFSHEAAQRQPFVLADGATIQTQIERDVFIGDDGDNSVTFVISGFHTLLGGDGNDTLQAQGSSTFDGEGGADVLLGGFGEDLFIADFDDQRVDGNAGLDTLSFENISAEGGLFVDLAENLALFDDDALTFANIENLIGRTNGDDSLFGGVADNSRVQGLGGDDILGVASVERTRVEGGAGVDTLVFTSEQRIEVNALQLGGENEGTFFLPDVVNSGFGTFNSVENFVGTDLDGAGDVINGTSIDNRIEGLGGDDTLNGQDGADTLLGGEGNDNLSGGGGADIFRFAATFGQDVIQDFVRGVDQIEIVANPDDVVFQNVGDDTLITVNGTTNQVTVLNVNLAFEDIIVREVDDRGNNAPIAQDDEATVAENASVDIAVLDNDVDADGDQLTLLSADEPESGRVEIIGNVIRYTPNADFVGTDSFIYQITDGNGGVDAATVTILVEADEDEVGVDDDLLEGDGGANILSGGVGADTLIGGGGADTLNGGAGGDSLSGGAGRDVVSGGGGGDVILGGGGADVLSGNGGRDEISGGGGRDMIAGGGGADDLAGNGGRDEISGGGGRDRIEGGGGADALAGSGGRDIILGGGGRDSIEGGGGADTLNGAAGRDEIEGGRGDDVLTGGAGADLFVFNTGDRRDVITDFQRGVDRIVVESGADGFDDLTFAQVGDNVRITFDNVAITVEDQEVGQFNGNDFLFG